jgi:hypothetical protein
MTRADVKHWHRFEDPNPLNDPDPEEETPVPVPPDDPGYKPPIEEPSKKPPGKHV